MSNKDKTNLEKEPPKRAKRAIKKLHTLVEHLEYFCGQNKFFKETIVKELAQDIEEVLHALSVEKNIDHIRLATKLKTIWARQEESRIENEVEKRVDEIKKNDLE